MTDTRTQTLAEFLLARIAEDEAEVMPGMPSPYRLAAVERGEERRVRMLALALGLRCPTCHADTGQTCMAMTPPIHAPKPAGSLHGTRMRLAAAEFRRTYGTAPVWNRARILSECEAKRRIIALHEEASSRDTCGDSWRFGEDVTTALAQPYADHPDFREE